MNMRYIVVLLFCLVKANIQANGQRVVDWGDLEISRFYGIGDMHLDQIKTKRQVTNHKSLMDSSAYLEYELLRYLVFERDVNYIFVELPVNFQMYLDLFLQTGELGELLKVFPSNECHVHAKFNYLRQLKAEKPLLKILCAEAGNVDQSLFYTTNLFFQITKQLLGNDTASINISWNYPLFSELYIEYNRQIDSLFEENQNLRLYELMQLLVKKRFKGSMNPEQDILKLSHAWLMYLKEDPDASRYFTEKDHIIEMIEWYMRGAKDGSRKLEKMRDKLITEFVLEKMSDDTSSAVLLFGNAHLSTYWTIRKNVTYLLQEKGFNPLVVEIAYQTYPYNFYPKAIKRKIRANDQANRLERFGIRSWGLIVN